LGTETIRATVIGAGCHSAQLSGSTVFYRNIQFPMKNLPVVHRMEELRFLEQPGVLALPGTSGIHYQQIQSMAADMVINWPNQHIFVALEADMAKALGHALALRADCDRPILCIDRVRLENECYLDVGAPVGDALPLVVKTLVLKR
jgi:ethanolamine utilization protein EutA